MDESKPITLHFNYTQADVAEAFRLYQSTTPIQKVVKIAAILALLNAGLCVYAYFQLTRLYGSSNGTEWYALASFLLALVFWFDPIRPLMARIMFRMNSKIYSDQSEVTFDEEGVHARTSTYDLKRQWSAYSKMLESKRLFLLVYGKNLFATIPRRAFEDERQIEAFREMMKNKIG